MSTDILETINITGLTDIQVLENRRLYGSNESKGKVIVIPKTDLSINAKRVKIIATCFIILSTLVAFAYQYYTDGPDYGRAISNVITLVLTIIIALSISYYHTIRTKAKTLDHGLNNNHNKCDVVRNGKYQTIDTKDIVVGDIVVIKQGDYAPADGILIKSIGLIMDESEFNGNSQVVKNANVKSDMMDNMCITLTPDKIMCNSIATEGIGVMKVSRVGRFNSHYNYTSGAVMHTPEIKFINKLSISSAVFVFILGLLVSIIGLIFYNFGIYQICTTFIVMIMSLFPLGVHFSATIIQAFTMNRLIKNKIYLKDINTATKVGQTTTIVTNKNGIITNGQLVVTKAYLGFGEKEGSTLYFPKNNTLLSRVLAKHIAISSIATIDNQKANASYGNNTDVTLLHWLDENKIDYKTIRQETVIEERIPNIYGVGYSATLVKDNEKYNTLFIKGNADILLGLSQSIMQNDAILPMDEARRSATEKILEKNTTRTSTTIAFAYAQIASDVKPFDQNGIINPNIDVTLLGFVSLDNVYHSNLRKFIRLIEISGINIKMVSSSANARDIAKRAGIIKDTSYNCLEANMINSQNITDTKVMFNASLEDKLHIVKTLRQNNEVVTVVSSESKEKPLLDSADVGVMYQDISTKQTSKDPIVDVMIYDKLLSNLYKLIFESRTMLLNVVRFVLYQTSISIPILILSTIGMLTIGQPIVSILQVFWINVIMCMIASYAIATIPPNNDVMLFKASQFGDFKASKQIAIWKYIVISILFFEIIWIWLSAGNGQITSVLQIFNTDTQLSIPHAHLWTRFEKTLISSIFVCSQFWIALSVKGFYTRTNVFADIKRSYKFFLILSIMPLLHWVAITFFGDYLWAVPISLQDWLLLFVITSPIFIITELLRFVHTRKIQPATENKL